MMKQLFLILTMILAASVCAAPQAPAQEELPVSVIFAKQSEAVVLIGTIVNKKIGHLGSGFVVRSDGLIVTNYHVIKDAKDMFIKFTNDRIYESPRMVSFDPVKDIAFIKIDAEGLKTVVMGNSNNIRIGQRVVAIGNPLGLESTVSDGLISALRIVNNGRKVLQTSVPLSSGSSGSPLFNLKGEVIGVTTSSRMDGQNLNFAIPINNVRSLMITSGYADTNRGAKVIRNTQVPENRAGSEPGLYTIKPKDTLYGIAKRFKTTADELMKLNNLSDTKITAGQQIRLPSSG